MADDIMKVLGPIFGGILSIIVLIFILNAFVPLFTQLGDQQCQPYKDTIAQKDIEIGNLNSLLNETRGQYDICRNEYDELVSKNITKVDFEEIKSFYNLTQIQVYNLEQKFDIINNNFKEVYNTVIWNYRISLIFNVTIVLTLLGVEILSFFFLKSEFIMFVINSIKNRRKKEHLHLPSLN